VIPPEFSVYNILLDGHNGTVREFSRSSMDKWKEQVHATLKKLLARHDKVVIVAHSMGTFFAISGAIQYPNRIPALFLLAVPTQPRVPLSTWVTSLKVAFGKLDTPEAQAMRSDTGIQLTPRLWEYMGWIPRMVELLQECRRIRKVIPLLTVPTQVFQSRVDELVSPRSCEDLSNPCMQTTILQKSGHFVYGPEDTALLQKCLLELLQSI
jgi:esterase/lipase